jgi:phosphopantetheinyl transferase (holo-ACP synthase)
MLWSAKEAMYKAYGQKEIDFREHMTVLAPDYRSGEMHFKGTLKKDDVSLSFTLFCKLFDRLMMVYAVQQ